MVVKHRDESDDYVHSIKKIRCPKNDICFRVRVGRLPVMYRVARPFRKTVSGMVEPSCIEDVIAGKDIVVKCAFLEKSSRMGQRKE